MRFEKHCSKKCKTLFIQNNVKEIMWTTHLGTLAILTTRLGNLIEGLIDFTCVSC